METSRTIARMTVEEFQAVLDVREAACRPGDLELVDGVMVEGEMPNRRHQMILRAVENLLEPWVRAKGGGTWSNPELQLSPHDVRQPDLIAWWSGQDVPLDGMMRDMPDLVVEVISPQPRDVRRDREDKVALYCRAGIPHYWTVEPLHRVLEVYLRQWKRGTIPDWQYQRVFAETRGIVSPPAGPVIDLDALWASVED